MKIERLQIENFRQYFGRQRIEFAKDPYRSVTVINGTNGAGKTSMFLAINWCLYGEGATNVGELISKEAVQRARVGEEVRAAVDLTFSHDGQRYLVRRVLKGTKLEGSRIKIDETPEFSIVRTLADGQAKSVSNPALTMNAILPANVRTYFLFDGEKIEHFARPEAAGEVKEAIYLVLRLEILDRARKHLEEFARDYRRELRQVASAELQSFLDQNEQARSKQAQAERRRKELQVENESARRKITDIDQRLIEVQSVSQLQQQRENAESNLKQLRTEQEIVLNDIRTNASSGYLVIAEKVIGRSLSILDEKRQKGEIPRPIRQQLIEDLFDQLVCICGRPFSSGGAEADRLRSYLERSISDSLETDVLETSGRLRGLQPQVTRQLQDLDRLRRRYVELSDRIRAEEDTIGDLEFQLKDSPLEDVRQLEKQRQDFRADIERNTSEIGTLNERLVNLAKEIAELDDAIRRAEKDAERERMLSTKLDLAQKSSDAIATIYQTFADEMRGCIEAKTKEVFNRLILKESHFQDIRLGPDYNLEIIDRYGLSARPELSAGERQILSLSFITAIATVSGGEVPLVMDTPLGRLSEVHRDNITKHLPDLAPQLVLFVTDRELLDQARANLEPRIGSEYRLDFDNTTSCTEIVEVK